MIPATIFGAFCSTTLGPTTGLGDLAGVLAREPGCEPTGVFGTGFDSGTFRTMTGRALPERRATGSVFPVPLTAFPARPGPRLGPALSGTNIGVTTPGPYPG